MNNLFVFSLGGSLRDMWSAGAYFLVVLIGTFSGAWPYIKVIMIGYCWCTPTGRYEPAAIQRRKSCESVTLRVWHGATETGP